MNSPHELSLRVNSLYVSGKIFVLKSCGQYVVTFDADTVCGVKWTAGCVFSRMRYCLNVKKESAMSLIVQKFGGSSVRDAERIKNVARIIAETYLQGHDVIVVLSAQGDTTDDLIAKAEEINEHASKREMDMLMSAGEQISVALCAMALESMGLPCISLTAWQVGIYSTSAHTDARIKRISPERVRMELDAHRIVIVTGFQGVDRRNDVTTLGRGGSDTSAVALAAAFHADICQIFTDVDGIYTTDPRIVPNARKLEEITYDEMLELASQGAQVLHNRSVELAKKFKVNLEVLSSLERKPGTKVKEVTKVEKTNIAGVAKDTSIARASPFRCLTFSAVTISTWMSLFSPSDAKTARTSVSPFTKKTCAKWKIFFLHRKTPCVSTISNPMNTLAKSPSCARA